MTALHSKSVNILLVDPDRDSCKSVAGVLTHHGFPAPTIGESLADILHCLGDSGPDLLICEAELPDGDPCELVHSLRHHEAGGNPFLPVIMVSGKPNEELIKRVVNSGVDDLMVKPLSSELLLARIEDLVNARKPFVVTTDYIGPDRHRKPRPGRSRVPLIDVPNVLRAKLTGETDLSRVQTEIDATISRVNLQKLQRHASQIGILVDLILTTYERGQPDDRVDRQLDRLLYVVEDTSRRIEDTGFDHVSDMCHSLMVVAREIQARRDSPAPRDIKLLRLLSQAIHTALSGIEDS